ncbi:YeeE/YedE family protein [Aurantimonas sp. A2-1-M11]|uniref:YeeE/YedE family protein n=1 Tax=Aurantimonas sp. A2-1-M11 TaxID=3113712 RepID=UPI002F953548
MTDVITANRRLGPGVERSVLILLALAAALAVAATAGAHYGLLLVIGLGFGITLEGLRFGFAGPWRAMIVRREPAGLLAQLVSIAIVAVFAIPLITANSTELLGAHAPVGVAMLGGAFVFGAAMQVVLGCGSGTLVNAGSGNPVGVLALPFFAIGSFAGAYHLTWWTELGTAPVVVFDGFDGVAVTLVGLALVAAVALLVAAPGTRWIPRRLWLAAGLLAALALANLVVAGQPWGVVYGLGLWAAKGAGALGADLSASAFWSAPTNVERMSQSILTDVTSLTNLGIIGGAFLVAAWRHGFTQPIPELPLRAWAATVVAGFLLGYSSRLAFGCNVGAFFSGVSTGSLHGWAWFVMAFGGAWCGIRLRPALGLEVRR